MNLSYSSVELVLIIVLAIFAAAAIGLLIKSGVHLIPRRVNRAIVTLRIFALISLLLALLNPFLEQSSPDPSAYRVAILADVSRSMETRDLSGNSSRMEWLEEWLNPQSGNPKFNQLVNEQTPVSVRLFSAETQPWNHESINSSPGQTAIGEALSTLYKGENYRSGGQLGGVLLLSDGINLSGEPPIETARKFNQAGIPVSVVGIGEVSTGGDVVINFLDSSKRFKEGEKENLRIQLVNTYNIARSGSLSVYQNGKILTEREVSLEANETVSLAVPIEGSAPGVDTLRADFNPGYTGDNQATNTSFAIAEIEPRDQYSVLLLASKAGWSERILRVLANESTSFTMDSLIRIDTERYFLNKRTSPSEQTEVIPTKRETLTQIPADLEFYSSYDALILDRSVLFENSDVLSPILSEFTGTKGGGALLVHSDPNKADSALPDSIRNLFPARDVISGPIQSPTSLQFDGGSLFTDLVGGVLFTEPSPVIPTLSELGVPGELSRASRVAVRTRQGNQPIFVTHTYGAGRAAWLATDSFWNWKLESDRGEEQYSTFWEAVLSWLVVGGKDRLEAPVNATIASMDSSVDLGISLLGRDYTPRMDASVTALLTGPDGQSHGVRLLPSIDDPGRYDYSELLNQAGTWRIDYATLFPDGDELKETSWFAVTASSPESTETAFEEKTLRDIARITGGSYRSYNDWKGLSSLPLSENIPQTRNSIYWTRSWPFLLLAFSLLVSEWWLRRRHGLR